MSFDLGALLEYGIGGLALLLLGVVVVWVRGIRQDVSEANAKTSKDLARHEKDCAEHWGRNDERLEGMGRTLTRIDGRLDSIEGWIRETK